MNRSTHTNTTAHVLLYSALARVCMTGSVSIRHGVGGSVYKTWCGSG